MVPIALSPLVVIIVTLALVAWFFYWQTKGLITTHYRVYVPGLRSCADGLRLVQLSDVHNAFFGPGQSRLLRRVKQAQPDLVVLTGDYVSGYHPDWSALQALLEGLKEWPVYLVPGNHDHATGLGELQEVVEPFKAKLLLNEGRTIAGPPDDPALYLAGVGDPIWHADRLEESLAGLEEGMGHARVIMLVHSPQKEFLVRAAQAGVDLVLAGHTHGGQLRIPGLPALYSPGQGWWPRFVRGRYNEPLPLVVSNGLGTSNVPLRLFSRPAVTVVDLKAGSSGDAQHMKPTVQPNKVR